MKRVLPIILILVLAGCSAGSSGGMETALQLRQEMSRGCSFTAEITADYETSLQSFTLSCVADGQSGVAFTVTAPKVIAGITGKMGSEGGELTFDDTAVSFSPLADGQLSPVSAPWVLVHTLVAGCITSCEERKEGVLLSIDDSYEENAMHLQISLDAGHMPKEAEILWRGRRILSMHIEDFHFL